MQGANLSGADFTGSTLKDGTLQGANLTDASFIVANLNDVNLQDADLSRAKLVQTQLDGADLTGACLTGAYIEDWGISTTTKLNGIRCDYVFMRLPGNGDPDPNPRRKPDDWNKTFADGEFADFIAPMVQTLDLYHNQAVDPRVVAIAFSELREQHPEAEIEIVSMEKRGKQRDKFLIRAEVSPQANSSDLHAQYFQRYDELRALPPQALILLLEEKEKHSQRLAELVGTAINRPGIYANTYHQQGDNMSEQKGNIRIGDVQGNISGIAAAGENQTITGSALGDISGTVQLAIQNLTDAASSDEPDIKTLLAQLHEAIASDSDLDNEEKVEALEQVKVLAEAGQNPQDGAMQKLAKRATTMLKGIAAGLPDAAKLAVELGKLLPAIATLFGLS